MSSIRDGETSVRHGNTIVRRSASACRSGRSASDISRAERRCLVLLTRNRLEVDLYAAILGAAVDVGVAGDGLIRACATD